MKLQRPNVLKLLDSCINLRDKILIQFLYNTAVRVSELINIQIEDIDFNQKTIFIHLGKGAKDRVVNISREFATLLQAFIGERKKGILFLSNWQKPFSARAIQKKIKILTRKTDLPKWVTPHTLRHSCAVHALQAGVNIQTIRKHLGHSALATTQIYTEISDELVKKDLEEHNPFSLGQGEKEKDNSDN